MGSPENPGSFADYMEENPDGTVETFSKALKDHRLGLAKLTGVSVARLHDPFVDERYEAERVIPQFETEERAA